MPAKSSINFKPAKPSSENHNERKQELDYVFAELSKHNESWKADEISNRRARIEDHYQKMTGQKMQAKATPVREAVVNLNAHHTLEDLQRLACELKNKKGIDCFQIHIHRDEGKSREELNHHAHMVFDWQDKKTGKSFKLNKRDMSEVQTLAAEHLGMERGELRENTNRKRLEAVEYKRCQEQKKVEQLKAEAFELEQKKKQASNAIRQSSELFERELKQQKAKLADLTNDAAFWQPTVWQKAESLLKRTKTSLERQLTSVNEQMKRSAKKLKAEEQKTNHLHQTLAQQNERLQSLRESTKTYEAARKKSFALSAQLRDLNLKKKGRDRGMSL